MQMSLILGFLRELTSHVALGSDVQPWDIIGMFVTRLSNDVNALLPQVQQSIDEGRLIQGQFSFLTCVAHADVTCQSLCRSTVGDPRARIEKGGADQRRR
jgi:hypothetical protein